MFARKTAIPLRYVQSFTFQTCTYRRVTSSGFSKVQSIPFTVAKSDAQEAFNKHHSKHLLLTKPVPSSTSPIPVYLPYYIFSATASLTYSARLGNTTYERRYDIFSGRWRIYPRTRYYDLPKQTLSEKEYPSTYIPLHIYASYNQPASWLNNLNTTDIVSLAGYNSLKPISGLEPKIDEFIRPIEGLKNQAVRFLLVNEEERARKYIQRTYDPDQITFTSTIVNYNLRWQQLYIPVWVFEFTQGNSERKYKTYVAGWSDSTSGPVVYNPVLSGAVVGVFGAIFSALTFTPLNWFTTPVIGGIVGIIAGLVFRQLPNFQRLQANRETEEIRDQDRKAAQQTYQRQKSRQDGGQQQQQSQTREQQQQQQRTRPKYPTDDPQGLYQTLEISPTATEAEIGAAYRRLARIHHPDMVQGGAKEKDAAKDRFQTISAAYQVLKDPRRRREYDQFGTTST